MHATTPSEPGPSAAPPARVIPWCALAVALSFATSLLFRHYTMHWALTMAVALLPVPAVLLVILAAVRTARHGDELERRVQLEALARAFGVAAVAFIVFNQLHIADLLGPEDWFMPWIAIFLGYTLSLAAARKRYQ